MSYDVEKMLKVLMPDVLRLLDNKKISWSTINSKLESHILNVKEEFERTGRTVEREATFYSIIIEKYFKENRADAMFQFFNELFKELNQILLDGEKTQIRGMIFNILSNTNKNYLNFIGEMAVLRLFMLSHKYNLKKIEEKISGARSITADICLVRKSDGTEILIEILNLHLEVKDFTDYEHLKYHLDSKYSEKTQLKHVVHNRTMKFQPVIWYKDVVQLKFISDFHNTTKYSYNNVLDPFCYISLVDNKGVYEHRFENIKSVLR